MAHRQALRNPLRGHRRCAPGVDIGHRLRPPSVQILCLRSPASGLWPLSSLPLSSRRARRSRPTCSSTPIPSQSVSIRVICGKKIFSSLRPPRLRVSYPLLFHPKSIFLGVLGALAVNLLIHGQVGAAGRHALPSPWKQCRRVIEVHAWRWPWRGSARMIVRIRKGVCGGNRRCGGHRPRGCRRGWKFRGRPSPGRHSP